VAENEKSTIDIAVEISKAIYSNVKFEHRGVQPIYVLHRDTVQTFLHEKLGLFEQQGKLLGLWGIEVSLIASLVTATFNDWLGIKGAVIEASFWVVSIICGYHIVRESIRWRKYRDTLSVDALSNELGGRGSVIQPNEQKANPAVHTDAV
jgi:hypothetical protein